MRRPTSGVLRQSYALAAVAVLGLAATFFQQWYPLAVTGAGAETDALIAGLAIPRFIIVLAAGAISAALTPMLSLASTRQQLADQAGSLAVAVALALTAVALLVGVTTAYWLPLLTPGFSEPTRALTASLMEIQLIGLPFAGVTVVQVSAFQARGRFVFAESVNMTAQLLGIAVTILALPQMGMAGAAWGIAVRYIASAPLLFLAALDNPVRFAWDAGALRAAWARMKPVVLGTAFARVDQLFDIFLASMASAGAVSLFNLAQQLHGAANLIANRAIAWPLIPGFSRSAARSEWPHIQRIYLRSLRLVLVWSALTLLLIAVVGQAAFALVFPGFSAADVSALWWLILASAGVLVAGSLAQIPIAGFYAIGDNATPTRVAVYGAFPGLAFKAAGYYLDGINGLAIGTSLYFATTFVALHVLFRMKVAQAQTGIG